MFILLLILLTVFKIIDLIGLSASPSPFSSLDWSDYKDDYGLIAGGMGDGAITIWDAKKII